VLVELHIRDLALIEALDLTFGPGLNAITGETGSGKSLLVGALEALLGQRPKGGPKGWVRSGAARARVDGRFLLASGPLSARVSSWLAEHLPEIPAEWEEDGEEGELVLSRTLGADGRTRAYVNHRPVTRRVLSRLARILFEIHGQNDHQRLLEPSEQRRLVDAMGEHEELFARYRDIRAGWLRAAARARELDETRKTRKRRLTDLLFQKDELESAGLSSGERRSLSDERQVLRAAEDLGRELRGVLDALSEGDDAALDRMRGAERTLDRWRGRIGRLEGATGEVREALGHLEEACHALLSFADEVEANPARLEEVETRLAELDRLERKYGANEDELIELSGELAVEIAELERAEESRDGMAEEVALLLAKTERAAEALSKARRKLAPRLARGAKTALAELGMASAQFEVSIVPRVVREADSGEPDPDDAPAIPDSDRLGPEGADDVEFLLGANPGEPMRPLRHVASGGEAARVMLALRSVLSVGPAPAGRGERTLVFDEIDSGVGGHLAPRVGDHLRALSRGDQVLCVTHLPAIAAAADRHLCVSKHVEAGRSRTVVAVLEAEARVGEVANMIGGGADHETARAEARRLLAR
jgi:DNA repair protein RecN (Recombination protein N)